MAKKKPDDAPETVNREQEDEGQNLGAPDPDRVDLGEVDDSERGNPDDPADLIPDDVPDLVERMDGMVKTGRIDNDAYRGEPVDDDEPDNLGDTGENLDDV